MFKIFATDTLFARPAISRHDLDWRLGMFSLLAAAIAVTMAISILPARAGNTTFLTDRNGNVVFPLSPPNRANSTPGAIDNMNIGATTPAPGKFTTFSSTDGLVCLSALPTTATDAAFFVATRPYIVVSVSEVHAVAAGGASVVQLVKDTGTAAPGAGTDLLTNNTNTGFNLNATANTVQVGTLVAVATRTLAAGDRLSYDFAQAIQSSAGIVITVCLAPQ